MWDKNRDKFNPVPGTPAADDVAREGRDAVERSAAEHSLDEQNLREMGYGFVDLIIEYFKGLEGRRVYGPMTPTGLDELFADALPDDPSPFSDILQDFRTRVFPNTMAIGSRRYFGMMNPAPLPVAMFSEALVGAMNQNTASWRHSPAGTAIEKRVIRWLCDLFGLPEKSFGTFTTGGSLANITGLKLAINQSLGRNLSCMDQLDSPGPEMAKLTFYVSGQGHYSFDKAVDLLGLGRNQLRKIPQDDIFRIDLDVLEASLEEDVANGLKPCCIIGIAGTTNTGSIDKLDKLGELSDRFGCWFHVDAAYGGAVILSDMYGPMLRGIDKADSITVDPHKWMYMPFSAGGILVRDGDFLRQSFLVRPEYYMEQVLKDGEAPAGMEKNDEGRMMLPDSRGFHHGAKVNFFQYGVEGSRRQNALKLWLAFRMVGKKQYASWVEKDIELARVIAARMRRMPDFEILGPNTLAICNFRWEPVTPRGKDAFTVEHVDDLNRQLQEAVERDGDAWFSYTVLKGRVALRVNVENRCMDQNDVERLVLVIRRAADRILEQ